MGQIIAFFDFDNFSRLLKNGNQLGFHDNNNRGSFYFFTCYENEYGGSWIAVCGNHGNCHDDCTFCHLCRSAKIILAPDIGKDWLYAPNQPFKFLRHNKTKPKRYAHLLNSPNLKGYEFSPEEAKNGNPYFNLAQEIERETDCGSTWETIKDFDSLTETAIELLEQFQCNPEYGPGDDFRTRVRAFSNDLAPKFLELIDWDGGLLRNFLETNEDVGMREVSGFIGEHFFRRLKF